LIVGVANRPSSSLPNNDPIDIGPPQRQRDPLERAGLKAPCHQPDFFLDRGDHTTASMADHVRAKLPITRCLESSM
jgi:hypothetical protein